MYDGKEKRRELIDELRSTHALQQAEISLKKQEKHTILQLQRQDKLAKHHVWWLIFFYCPCVKYSGYLIGQNFIHNLCFYSNFFPIKTCLLYTSDAADDLLCVDLGGRRII